MIEVIPGLFVGSQADFEASVREQPGWAVVHACKEPYHRQALGYTTRGAPQNHPEYLIAQREDRLILNLVDAPDPKFIRPEIMDAAIAFIGERLDAGQRVLVHCNEGRSRGPGIALLFLHTQGSVSGSFPEAEHEFRKLYPETQFAGGIRGFLEANWERYAGGT